ncbi:hypothetical protein [Rhodococcus sp. I2R]|jgi:hypothetical protein|uniref:hypothetical protein n=1 Tax=Rhodococcus sp. I2R TaxID=2855445 RepID=UPI001E490457|nr:hypothetical protein [Rhodococcus sp. I2R]MCC8927135.1 hypothetical protein [Rhodococcus sp. I2R]
MHPPDYPAGCGVHGTILRTVDACHYAPDLTDIVAAVKRQHPEVPLIAVMRTIGELVASGVLWPIGGFERTNREMKIDPTTNQGGRKR